jgi:hypothetical protein
MPIKKPATMPLAMPTPHKLMAYQDSIKDSASKLHRIYMLTKLKMRSTKLKFQSRIYICDIAEKSPQQHFER